MAANSRTSTKAPNVTFIRPEVTKLLPQYELIRDCLAGETAIKAARGTYLPMPNAHDTSEENKERYDAYLKRAVFVNVTRRTLSGLIGQVFLRDPVLKAPVQLEPMLANATGTGISFVQLAKMSLGHCTAYSRGGVFVDFTNTGGQGATRDQVERGEVRPTVYAYSPLEIINWRVTEVGSKDILSLVVLVETYPVSDDGFEVKTLPQFRVLKLENGLYKQEIWRDPLAVNWDGKRMPKGNYSLHETIVPTDSNGNRITEIPFHFIGSENNDVIPEDPNLYDIASLNVAHYRNSADYEESCFVVGQPTPVAVGLTEEWVSKVLNGKLAFGSRGGIPLPVGADAKLLQADPNTMIKEAMTDKLEQMRSLGAKLVEQKSNGQKTATQSRQDGATESSVLASCAKNVSTAYLWALNYASRLMGLADTANEFALNTDFDLANMTPEQVRVTVELWQKGGITFEEMRNDLRRYGVATVDDAKAKADIAKEQIDAMALVAENDPAFNQPPPADGA